MNMKNPHAFPVLARSERIVDGVVHGIGVLLAITGAVLLIVFAALGASGAGMIAALSVYAAALIATFTASACYHLIPWQKGRAVLRRIDHAAIYLKIAGTYTPLVVLIGSGFAYAVLGVVWALAAIGMIAKLFFWRSPGRLGAWLYLGMGWLSMALIWSLFPLIPLGASILIAVGGLLYSSGVIFYSWQNLRFQTAIWHGFVLVASACFFAAICWGALVLT